MRFELLPGHRFDTVGIEPLLKDIEFRGLIADKAFDNDTIVAKIVISQHPRRTRPLPLDPDLYNRSKLKAFKRTAMRADKTDQSFSAKIYLAAAVINSR